MRKFTNDFWFLNTGERRPAVVPDGERSHAADCEGPSGLCDGESSVHPEWGLAAVAGPGLQLAGTHTPSLFPHTHICLWSNGFRWVKQYRQHWPFHDCSTVVRTGNVGRSHFSAVTEQQSVLADAFMAPCLRHIGMLRVCCLVLNHFLLSFILFKQ